MNALVAALLVAPASASFAKIVESVNAANTTWAAAAPARFGDVADVRRLCGAWTRDHAMYSSPALPEYEANPFIAAIAAESLDWREAAPHCTVIAKIRDQSSCGSCWAFGSTETYEDRRCVATGEDVEFSTMDTAGCCSGFACGLSRGCGGGQPTAALKWMTKTGVVSGADYFEIGKGGSCKPYTFAPCAHHVAVTPEYPACPEKEYEATCTRSCSEEKYGKKYADDKVAEGTAKSCRSVAAMMTALQKGPLSATLTVYEDFPTYKSGVYRHVSGSALGGHAIEIIGYGTEEGTPYWLVKNSWNEMWGLGGTIKILRGSDECGIESDVAAVDF
ncbi:hypothetical protein M885DRAFT_480104 [Pelagophyceae sp. CCMP2097]|nr:hypothetical protein M885DRAFT_480104 [Pelagophyceae sp. CCMP2097]|mmetsp:Transcript_32786/g.110465  ORF Transcript_32786/g.110465 Transcript_32786/m.110465 type:complete len:333 (-) Transcript_32786:157-1155(-)